MDPWGNLGALRIRVELESSRPTAYADPVLNTATLRVRLLSP